VARTRFAPSPTGSLHVGGVRTALYCWLYARKTGGQFLLRIEDTDQVRSTDEATKGIVRDLRWVGLDWDEGPEVGGPDGPYLQSQRLALYDSWIDTLLASGAAYEAWDDRSELEARRKEAEARKETFLYRRQPISDEQIARYKAEGRKPVVRLAFPPGEISVHDAVLGDVVVPGEQLDDLVLRKADGFPTYHYAVVIDDHHMHVDLVLRGQEHLMNTHKHVGIYRALGWAHPQVGHLPLIFNPKGQKMSKREKAQIAREAARKRLESDPTWRPAGVGDELAAFVAKKTDAIATAEAIARDLGVELPLIEVMDYRKAGYVPEALLNYLLLLGWHAPDDREFYTLAEAVDAFDLDRINKTSARFDPVKLRWMNGEWLWRLDPATLERRLGEWLEVRPESALHALPAERRRSLVELWRGRAATFSELETAARFLFEPPTAFDPKAVAKHLADGGLERLDTAIDALSRAAGDAAALEAAVAPLTDGTGPGMGRYAQPLRVALTGTAVSPPIFDVLAWLGAEAVPRLRDARARL
jgi:glutamyl/glutaminyl-tRNA synthetase